MILKDLIIALNRSMTWITPDEDRYVRFGFGRPLSWRGDYSEVCFEPVQDTTVGTMLFHAQSAVDTTFHGYKGGEFTMRQTTPCHINFHGECGDDAITPFMLAWMLDRPVQMWDWDPMDVPWKWFW